MTDIYRKVKIETVDNGFVVHYWNSRDRIKIFCNFKDLCEFLQKVLS